MRAADAGCKPYSRAPLQLRYSAGVPRAVSDGPGRVQAQRCGPDPARCGRHGQPETARDAYCGYGGAKGMCNRVDVSYALMGGRRETTVLW